MGASGNGAPVFYQAFQLPLKMTKQELQPGFKNWKLTREPYRTMHKDTRAYNNKQSTTDKEICSLLANEISEQLPDAENKVWHAHPVWFLEGNPIVGYSKLKAGIRLMFWSGADFEEEKLKPGTGKFKDASIVYTGADQINT